MDNKAKPEKLPRKLKKAVKKDLFKNAKCYMPMKVLVEISKIPKDK